MGVLFVISSPCQATRLDSLEYWAFRTFHRSPIQLNDLKTQYYVTLAQNDWAIAMGIAAGVSYIQYTTIDSALMDIAYCSIRNGDFSFADDILDKLEKLYPRHSQVIYLRAMYELYKGSAKKAEKILVEALDEKEKESAPFFEENFLLTSLGIVEVLEGKIKSGFKKLRTALGLSPRGRGSPLYEARLIEQQFSMGIIEGTLLIRQHYGRPSMLLRMRPITYLVDGSRYIAGDLSVEQIASIYGSPYFQLGVTRTGRVFLPRWGGIPTSSPIDIWLVFIDSQENLDSTLVKVSGALLGYAFADSFVDALDMLEKKAIIMWFDSIANSAVQLSEPLWRFNLSREVGLFLSDSTQWERGISFIDSLIQLDPDISQLYLWRGALSLFMNDFETALEFFKIPVETDSCNVDAYYDAGVASYLLENYEDAIDYFSESIECQDKFAPAYLSLGVIYMNDYYDKAKAIENFHRYHELSDFLQYEVEEWLEKLEE